MEDQTTVDENGRVDMTGVMMDTDPMDGGHMNMNMPQENDNMNSHSNHGNDMSDTDQDGGDADDSNSNSHSGHDHSSHQLFSGGSNQPFCSGEGMVMYMDGFRWGLKGGGQPCVNLFFPGWTLDTPAKFSGAMIGIVLLAVLTEGISKVRHNLSRKGRREVMSLQQARRFRAAQTGIHGFHALIGYILMLATMTFCLELLFCVILGLVIGYVAFGGDAYSHVANPCCAFLEDEAKERDPSRSTDNNPATQTVASTAENNDDLESSCCNNYTGPNLNSISEGASASEPNQQPSVEEQQSEL